MSLLSQLKKKRKGFVMAPVILATIIVGLLAVGLTSIYSGAFAVMSASKVGNEAGNIAGIEKEILKTLGMDGYSAEVSDSWKEASSLIGEDIGKQWEYKVTKGNEITKDDNKIQLVNVSVRKKGENTVRYSEDVPLSSQSGSGDGGCFEDIFTLINGNDLIKLGYAKDLEEIYEPDYTTHTSVTRKMVTLTKNIYSAGFSGILYDIEFYKTHYSMVSKMIPKGSRVMIEETTRGLGTHTKTYYFHPMQKK